ncbi:MAG: hypothetical protein CL607_28785 [Anaerolineaceae bacterium]|jgi:hypothetical protein|nr:hypothetical protein [Anaerolineaceae bacterium]
MTAATISPAVTESVLTVGNATSADFERVTAWVNAQLDIRASHEETATLEGWGIPRRPDKPRFKQGHTGGYLVLLGTPQSADRAGEYFTAQTDFELTPHKPRRVRVCYQHKWGELPNYLTYPAKIGLDANGVWIKHQLDLSNLWEFGIWQLVRVGAVGWSSRSSQYKARPGTTQQTAQQAISQAIKQWPIEHASYSPCPVDFRNVVWW